MDIQEIKNPYFIKKGAWYYRSNHRGYTEFPAFAGLYEKEEAEACAAASRGTCEALKACDRFPKHELDALIVRLTIIQKQAEAK